MLRILSHCHVFPKGIFERNAPDAGMDGTPAELARCARQMGFDRAVAFAPGVAGEGTRYYVTGDANAWLAEAVAEAECSNLIPFMHLNPQDGQRAVEELEKYAALGFRGIKIHPEIQRIDLEDPGLDGFFAAAERLRLAVITHTGVLRGNWPLLKYEPRLFEPFIADHPGLNLILAHAGGVAYFRQVLPLLQSYPNAYADLAGVLVRSPWYIPLPELYLARDLGVTGRLIYGADWPWGGMPHVQRDLDALAATDFTEDEKAAMLGGTLANTLGLSG
jgi:hypothetical protein